MLPAPLSSPARTQLPRSPAAKVVMPTAPTAAAAATVALATTTTPASTTDTISNIVSIYSNASDGQHHCTLPITLPARPRTDRALALSVKRSCFASHLSCRFQRWLAFPFLLGVLHLESKALQNITRALAEARSDGPLALLTVSFVHIFGQDIITSSAMLAQFSSAHHFCSSAMSAPGARELRVASLER